MSGKETANGETINTGNWISWRRRRAIDNRRFGKLIEDSGKLYVVCQSSGNGDVPDAWGMNEFEWAVAEGRIPAKSVWVVDDKLTKHERRYISSSG